MRSLSPRINLVMAGAVSKYGPLIEETEHLLLELIALVRALDPVAKRTVWPSAVVVYLVHRQKGRCPACRKALPPLSEGLHHVDHVVPWVRGGDNGPENLQLLHAKCNLAKGQACDPDQLIRYLAGRLLNLRQPHTD